MKLTAVLLLLVAVGVALAGPQRSSRRFTPRRSQVTAEEAAPEADPAEAEEPAKPRFRIAGRPSGSSFTPKRSSSVTPAPIVDAAPVEGAVAAPVPVARASAPVARAPAQASSPRSRSRGSRTFAESIKLANIPIEASQLEELEKSKQSLQRISSRPSSRPSSRVAVSKSPAPTIRKPSRPSSIRKPVEQPSTPAKAAEPETVVTTPSPRKPSGGDQEARRQRLLALKNRPRAGAKSSTPKNAEESMPEEKTAQASTASDAETEGDMMEKKAETMKEKNVPKLDEEVNKTLDETIKSEAKQENGAMKKDMPAKDMGDKATDVEKAEKKMPEEAETSASAVTPEPEVSTTTTAAPSARPRRINSLSKLRASRPASGTRTGGSRPQASSSAPAREAPAPATEVQPRLSSRRGGRGNSRGGAALATPTRISRPSSRAQASRTAVTADQEADAAGEAPAAVTTGSPSTTTQTTSTTTQSISTTTVWKPRVAPEDPVDATFNRGGFRFQPHPSSESDITRRRGEVVLTEVGTLEDTPPQQVAAILRGLGGRRRGLARPPASRLPPTTKSAMKDEFAEPDYYYDDY